VITIPAQINDSLLSYVFNLLSGELSYQLLAILHHKWPNWFDTCG